MGECAWPAAVLWDMDGTLVDTEPYWIETEFALAAEYGGTWSSELALELVGNDLITSGRFIRRHMGIDLTPEEIVERLLDGVVARVRHEVPWRPGARDLLERLGEAEVPCALVTMSYERFVAPILDRLPAGSFRVVVTGDAVTRGKPDPEPYLTRRGCWRSTRAPVWPSRTPTPAPRPPRRLAARFSWCRTTSPYQPDRGAPSARLWWGSRSPTSDCCRIATFRRGTFCSHPGSPPSMFPSTDP